MFKFFTLLFKILFIGVALVLFFSFFKLATYFVVYLLFFFVASVLIVLVHHFLSKKNRGRVLLVFCGVIALIGLIYSIMPLGVIWGVVFLSFSIINFVVISFLQWFIDKICINWFILFVSIIVTIVLGIIIAFPILSDYKNYNEIKFINYEDQRQIFSDVNMSNDSARVKAFKLIDVAQKYELNCDKIKNWPTKLTCYNYGNLYIDAMAKVGQQNEGIDHDLTLTEDICKTTFADYYHVGGKVD